MLTSQCRPEPIIVRIIGHEFLVRIILELLDTYKHNKELLGTEMAECYEICQTLN